MSPKKSLSTILLPYSLQNYQILFTPKIGFLTYADKSSSWKIEQKTPENSVEYYNEIINCLIKTKAYQDIPNIDAFIKRLNSCLTHVMDIPFNSTVDKSKTIFFNSKSQNFKFLSNFYSTLILFRDHDNPEKTRLYPSCENAYQTHKIANIFQLQKTKRTDKESNLETTLEYETCNESGVNYLEQLATVPPSKSKELAGKLAFVKNTDEIAKMKYTLMHDIVTKKFEANPMISQWLKETGSALLVENTSDRFWGSKKAHDPSLNKSYKAPISAESRNVLGRILMDIRRS